MPKKFRAQHHVGQGDFRERFMPEADSSKSGVERRGDIVRQTNIEVPVFSRLSLKRRSALGSAPPARFASGGPRYARPIVITACHVSRAGLATTSLPLSRSLTSLNLSFAVYKTQQDVPRRR